MNTGKQVDKSHYDFQRYMDKGRWNSVWHQLDEIARLNPERVLEIGPGPGLFKQVAQLFNLRVETLDLDPELKPDHIGSATSLPFPDGTFDVVCAFQMLEHIPYEESLKAFRDMARVSRGHVVISLPDSEAVHRYQVQIPKIAAFDRLITKRNHQPKVHQFDGEHYWELNKVGYELEKVSQDLASICPLVKRYRVKENPYHHFFIFRAHTS